LFDRLRKKCKNVKAEKSRLKRSRRSIKLQFCAVPAFHPTF
jgi:hypothetical protein